MFALKRAIVLVSVLSACGEPAPPSCQQAVTHYYDAGCTIVDPQTGQPYQQDRIISECKDLLAAAPDRCLDEIDDLRICWAGVRSPASSNSDCDCSQEQDALLSCD